MTHQPTHQPPRQQPPPGVPPEVDALIVEAMRTFRQHNIDEALVQLNLALAKARDLKSNSGQATVLYLQGRVEASVNRHDSAIQAHQQAISFLKDSPDSPLLPLILVQLGNAQLSSGQPRPALQSYLRAKTLFAKTNQVENQANILTQISHCQLMLGDRAQAKSSLTEAITLFEKTNLQEGLANALMNMGTFYSGESNGTRAFPYFSRALAIAQSLKNDDLMAGILLNTGIVQLRSFDTAARRTIESTIPLFEKVGNLSGLASARMNLGTVLIAQNQPGLALQELTRALELHRQLKNVYFEHRTLGEIATLYNQVEDFEHSIPLLEQALNFFRANHFDADTLAYTNILSGLYHEVGRTQEAQVNARAALILAQQQHNLIEEANAEKFLAGLALKEGDIKGARTALFRALKIFEKLNSNSIVPHIMLILGNSYIYERNYSQALIYYKKALVVSQALKDTLLELTARFNIVTALRPTNLTQAVAELQVALALAERHQQLFQKLPSLGISQIRGVSYYNRMLVLGLMIQKRLPDAFAQAQHAKNRALRERMGQVQAIPFHTMTLQERTQEEQLKAQLSLINRRLVKEAVQNDVGGQARSLTLQAELTKREAELNAFTDSLYSRYPKLAGQRAVKVATKEQIASRLPLDTLLVEFIVLQTGESSKNGLIMMTLQQDKQGKPQLSFSTFPNRIDEITELVADFRSACADPTKAYSTKARLLYDRLFAPIEAQLIGKKRLILCPDSLLWELPFAALIDHNGQFLAQRFEISYSYSGTMHHATMAARQATPSAPKSLLAVANPDFGSEERFATKTEAGRPILQPDRPILQPDRAQLLPRGTRITPLPGTQKEAEVLQKLFPDATVLTGKAAQESAILPALTKHRFIHLATHGFFNDALPLYSLLLLAEPLASQPEHDGFLTAKELLTTDLSRCELVVLSACNTARGKVGGGEGLIGLPWALFAAGCRTQVVSQWAVNDTTTATLMEHFYTKIQQKLGKGAALRSAALGLMKDGTHQHPYYWAPFILLGDWR